ncbi:SDR family oxidoreductase [Beijerinckia indica]|uniref:Short-chain dehydrogenase/reductase SDR n=1 Tax=Beijerinckia indica subsp. indica (strain ATCC 9039 / DSM 1715 / NCIMB 8712) TaxID=395963 RepID=B2IIF9_BEII9|nr:SDR family oxidoreductase [Beijerinckia indica]ACB96112.1 short-chain dehydrogenase/reductase SDR [Beijerinckia indica subsp. indica ATCC 9039]
MSALADKKMVVIGGSGDVGRKIVEAGARLGAQVLAVARRSGPLEEVARDVPGISTLSLDATADDAPARVFAVARPDILVLSGGALPPAAPLHEQSWGEFAANWEQDTKMTFQFCKAALSAPLDPGSMIIVIASGAALAGSPNTGGYAGAKRTQMFIANYSQKESARLGRGLTFKALAPRMMPETNLGRHAVAGYARYLGITEADFIRSMEPPPTAADVAASVVSLLTQPDRHKEHAFIVSGKGLEAVAG